MDNADSVDQLDFRVMIDAAYIIIIPFCDFMFAPSNATSMYVKTYVKFHLRTFLVFIDSFRNILLEKTIA